MIQQPWGEDLPPVFSGRRLPAADAAQRSASTVSQTEASDPVGEKKPGGMGRVVAVQSIACVVVLALLLLLRTVGGGAYTQLQDCFRDSLMRNDLLATLARLWDGDPAETVSGALESRNDQASAAEGTPSGSVSDMPQTSSEAEGVPPDNSSDGRESSASESQTLAAAGTGGRLPPDGALAVPLRVNRCAVPPLRSGTLTSGYGYRDSPTGGDEQFHRGVDIAAPEGTPIAAMFFGTVVAADESVSFGRYVRLSHGDGVEVLYAHCSCLLVSPGTVVRPGETVALVGATGAATGNHLHIQVSCDGIVYHPGGIVPLDRYVRRA